MDLGQIINFLLENIVPFLLVLIPTVGIILKKIKVAQKETTDVINSVAFVIDEATDVLEKFGEIIVVKDDGNVDINPTAVKEMIEQAKEVSIAASAVKKEVEEMLSAWEDIFRKG